MDQQVVTYRSPEGQMSRLSPISAVLSVAALALSGASFAQVSHDGHTHDANAAAPRTHITTDAAGAVVAVDRQTGKARPLTAAEAQYLADGLKQLVNQSSEGLNVVQRADGSSTINLEGRFQSVMLARKEDNGTVTLACVDNPESAAAFFSIDPRLLGIVNARRSSPPAALELR